MLKNKKENKVFVRNIAKIRVKTQGNYRIFIIAAINARLKQYLHIPFFEKVCYTIPINKKGCLSECLIKTYGYTTGNFVKISSARRDAEP